MDLISIYPVLSSTRYQKEVHTIHIITIISITIIIMVVTKPNYSDHRFSRGGVELFPSSIDKPMEFEYRIPINEC